MNPILGIWKKRIAYLARLYYKFISFQIDGVIFVYLLGLIGVLGFSSKEIILDIITYLPVGYMKLMPQIVFMLSLISGNLNGYLKLADQVFLSPLNIEGKKFLKYSHSLSCGIQVLIWSLIWTILYFYYRINFKASINIYLVVLICGAILRLTILNFKFILWNKQGKWKRRLYHIFLYSLVSSFIGFVLPIVAQEYIPTSKILVYGSSSIILLIISQIIKSQVLIDWERLINEETNKRVQNFSFLLGEYSKEKKGSRGRTISIFSGRKIIPFNQKGALLFLYFKMLQRGKNNLTLLLQLYFMILAAVLFGNRVVISSGIAEIQIFTTISIILTAYLVGAFLSSIWSNFKEDIWFQIYPYSLKEKISAIQMGLTIALTVFLLFLNIPLSILSGWIFNPIVDFVLILVISIIIAKIHSYLLKFKLQLY